MKKVAVNIEYNGKNYISDYEEHTDELETNLYTQLRSASEGGNTLNFTSGNKRYFFSEKILLQSVLSLVFDGSDDKKLEQLDDETITLSIYLSHSTNKTFEVSFFNNKTHKEDRRTIEGSIETVCSQILNIANVTHKIGLNDRQLYEYLCNTKPGTVYTVIQRVNK